MPKDPQLRLCFFTNLASRICLFTRFCRQSDGECLLLIHSGGGGVMGLPKSDNDSFFARVFFTRPPLKQKDISPLTPMPSDIVQLQGEAP